MNNIKTQLQKKGGISLAWDSLGFFVLAVVVLIVIIVLIFNFAKTGNGFFELLGDIF